MVTPIITSDGTSDAGVDLPPQPVLSPDIVPLLEELLGFYEQFARECSDYPRLRKQAAEANQRIGDIRQRLGQLEPAIAAYDKAIDLYEAQVTEPNDENALIRLARTYNELGRALRAPAKRRSQQRSPSGSQDPGSRTHRGRAPTRTSV